MPFKSQAHFCVYNVACNVIRGTRREFSGSTSASKDLQDPITEALSQAYARDGARFTFVGPLLLPPAPDDAKPVDSVICRLREARAAGKRVVAVSMGTVVTGGDKVAGWDADSRLLSRQ